MAYCTQCSQVLIAGDKFCAACGAPVRETEATPLPAATSAQVPTPTPEATPNIEATVDVRVGQERATNCTAVHPPNSGYTQNPGTGCIGP